MTDNKPTQETPVTDAEQNIGFMSVIKSTIAAACGIQSNANRERDFSQGKASTFIIAGIVFVVAFVLIMYGIVQAVLATAS